MLILTNYPIILSLPYCRSKIVVVLYQALLPFDVKTIEKGNAINLEEMEGRETKRNSTMVIEQCFHSIVSKEILGRGNGCNFCNGD